MTCWSVRGSGVDLAAEVKRPTRRSDRQTQGAEFARQPVFFAGRTALAQGGEARDGGRRGAGLDP